MGASVTDYNEILEAIQVYLEGCTDPSAAKLRSVFHPQAQLFGIMAGKTIVFYLEAWLERVTGDPKPAADAKISAPPINAESWKVKSVKFEDNIAMAVVVSKFLEVWYTDYLTFLREEQGWKIVNKTFTYEKI